MVFRFWSAIPGCRLVFSSDGGGASGAMLRALGASALWDLPVCAADLVVPVPVLSTGGPAVLRVCHLPVVTRLSEPQLWREGREETSRGVWREGGCHCCCVHKVLPLFFFVLPLGTRSAEGRSLTVYFLRTCSVFLKGFPRRIIWAHI